MKHAPTITITTPSARSADTSKMSTASMAKRLACRLLKVWAWRSRSPTSSSAGSAAAVLPSGSRRPPSSAGSHPYTSSDMPKFTQGKRKGSVMSAENTPHATGSTTQAGIPAVSDRNSLTVGPDGPVVLHDHHLIETLQHFNRMNVPERRPHAKGSGAFGKFTVTEDVSKYTAAAMFHQGVETDMLARFSTVAGELGSPDTWRDLRGFALKFYTEEGNFDLVGNHTPIFFVRDTMKFPHFIRSQKRLPENGLRDNNMQWVFWTQNTESSH